MLFHAAGWGVVFLALSLTVIALTQGRFPWVEAFWKQHIPFAYAGTSTLALILGVVSWWPLNRWFYPEEQSAQRTIERWDDQLEILLARANRETKLVAITLKSRKVYVGLVTQTINPLYDRKFVPLLPFKSGFRDPTNLKMTLNVDYSAVYAKIIRYELQMIKSGVDDFVIVVPVSEIESINLFDPHAYAAFNPTSTGLGSK